MEAFKGPASNIMFGLGAKLAVWFTLVFTLVFLGAFYWFYVFSTERAVERIVEDMQDTVSGAAAGLDGEAMARLYQTGLAADGASVTNDPDYAAQMAWVQTVQQIEPRAWPYTYVAGAEPNQIVALVDLWILSDPSKAYEFLEIDHSIGPLTEGLEELTIYVPRDRRCDTIREPIEGQPLAGLRGDLRFLVCQALRRVGYTDVYGSWISAYAPVSDADGVVRGAVGLDFEMAYVDHVQNTILASTAQAFLITYGALLLLVLGTSRMLTRPIVRLTTAAERVGEGEYNVDFSTIQQHRFRDQIGVLADVLQGMTEKVRTREQTLRRKVQELRIEIDDSKRAQEVQEIVDTDFFRELQAKAKKMRERTSDRSSES